MKGKIIKENGITLIALVITIIVLLILAGVAISSLAGENGVITKAKEAKIQTTKGQIQEILDLAVIEGTMLEKNENELFDFAIGELKEKGYTVINKTDNSTTGVNKIELSESKVQVKENESKAITVTIDETSYTNRYYVKIEKKYFEILQDSERIKLAENETDIDNITPGEEKQIEVTGASYCTVAINQATKEITITGGENLGTDTLTVKYGGKQATCEVEVGSYITSLILTTADGTKITNGMQLELNKGDGLIITATTNSDAKEQISWTNSNTSVTPMTVSENKKTVNLTGSTVGTSTITASTVKIKISFTVKVVVEDNTLVSKIKPENYGDVIKGYSVLEGDYKIDEWKVFLNDGNNVWIIPTNTIAGRKLDSTTQKLIGYDASDGWIQPPGNTSEGEANERCVNRMLDTANWTAYVNSKLAVKAMGGPTIEMVAKSWNDKYSEKEGKELDYQFISSDDGKGYQMRWKITGSEDWSDGISGEPYFDVDTASWIKSDEKYWIANTCYISENSIINYYTVPSGYSGGGLESHAYAMTNIGFRPVVCLNQQVEATSTTTDGVTTWTIK